MLVLSFLIGVVAGLRSLTAPALVAWAARIGWLRLDTTALAFAGSTAAVIIFTLLALGELVADQLPSTPARTAAPGLIARVVLGGFSGACLSASAGSSLATGAVLGAAGGIAGAFGGYQARTRTVKALGVRDLPIALLEDALAIGAGIAIVAAV